VKKISELLVSIALFLFGILPSIAFFVWIERNMALPWVGTWIAWPWIFIDGGITGSILFNLGLIAAFGFLHSALAGRFPRPWYVVVAGLSAVLVMAGWQPTGIILYQLIPSAVACSVVSMLLYYGFLLVGYWAISQVESPARFLGVVRSEETATAAPRSLWKSGLYGKVRHPLYTLTFAAWILTPMMSLDRVVFILGMALYLAFAIRREERRMVVEFGEAYSEYQRSTPMLIPRYRSRPQSVSYKI
jgi:protein-S-isoprenylcysteine O-methyltransferase Ste14